MSKLENKYFHKFINQRLRFVGIYDGAIELKKDLYRICFIQVYEAPTNEFFRQHVNILCDAGQYKNFFQDATGQVFEFTAELYNYTKNPPPGTFYRVRGVGLRDLNRITLKENQEVVL